MYYYKFCTYKANFFPEEKSNKFKLTFFFSSSLPFLSVQWVFIPMTYGFSDREGIMDESMSRDLLRFLHIRNYQVSKVENDTWAIAYCIEGQINQMNHII